MKKKIYMSQEGIKRFKGLGGKRKRSNKAEPKGEEWSLHKEVRQVREMSITSRNRK